MADDAGLAGTEGHGSAEPDVAQAFFEQDGGEGCGGDGAEGDEERFGEGHGVL